MSRSPVVGFLLGLALFVSGAVAAEPPAPKLQTTQGIFLGIEQGDYAHWKIRKANGKEASFFILRPDDAVKKALAKPQDYTGQTCRVHWQKTAKEIPEAGGKQVVKQIVSVEWPKAK